MAFLGQSSKKKTAISSSNKSQTVGPDRISDLPDSLIHNIFRFLDMKQVVQTSVLSKRWKTLWVSNPFVSIKFESMYFDDFKDYVNRVLLLRDGSNIDTFYLQCGYPDEFRHCKDIWITSVIRRNVQEVELVSFEISLSNLKSLLAQVKSLKLFEVRFELENNSESDGDSSESDEILMSSSVLEHLKLEHCSGCRKLTISAPNLKKLVVSGDEYSCSVIKVCAQNLKVLQIKGYMSEYEYELDNLESLESAECEIYGRTEEDEDLAHCLANILKGLYYTKSLTLSAEPFQDFQEVPQLLDSLAAFQNLGYLKLTELSTTKYMSAIVKLLEKFPNLETLVLVGTEIKYKYSECKGGDWEAQLLPCMLFHLKSIEIGNPHECANFYKFLEFLLKNAVDLESIVMTATTTQTTDETKKLVKVGKKLQVAPKSSSKVKIFLKERDGTVKEI